MNFQPVELQYTGVYPTAGEYYGYGPDTVPVGKRFRSPITPRENFLRFMAHQPHEWVPSFEKDLNLICPDVVPDFVACGLNGGVDSFGVTWIPSHPELGLPSFVKGGNPLLKDIADWREVIQFPDVDSWDWEGSAKLYSVLDRSRASCGIILSFLFERLILLMDFEGAAMALVEDPEETEALFEALCDYNIQILEHYKKYYDVDAVMVHDDWGSQRAPFFSRAVCQEVILPSFQRFNQRAHELGVYVIHHCCGCSEDFIEDMIACGSDGWQAQPETNPNMLETIRTHKDNFVFDLYGYDVPPEITDEETVKELVREAYSVHTRTGNVLYSVCPDNPGNTADYDAIGYEIARKICTGEL